MNDWLFDQHLAYMDEIRRRFDEFWQHPATPRSTAEIRDMYKLECQRVLQWFEYLLCKYYLNGDTMRQRICSYYKDELQLVCSHCPLFSCGSGYSTQHQASIFAAVDD